LRVCLAFFLVLCAAGFASLYSFRSRAPLPDDDQNRAMMRSGNKAGPSAAEYAKGAH
jgi:hypothetical protein